MDVNCYSYSICLGSETWRELESFSSGSRYMASSSKSYFGDYDSYPAVQGPM
jgi:hypothetical protein